MTSSTSTSLEFKLNSLMALLASAGGIIGYSKSKSMPSLVAGSIFGILYGTSAYYINQGNSKLGLGISVVASSLLGGVMGKKAMLTQKPVPIIMSSGSILTGLVSGKSLYDHMYKH